MLVFPNAKINIGLNILEKRPDNFHNIQTIFYPIGLSDALEVVEDNSIEDDFEISFSGIEVDAEPQNNLVVKAYLMLKDKYKLPKIRIHLHKNIPFGAGMGGGSSDAAFMLVLLNNLFDIGLNQEQLLYFASLLGSDCAFFVLNYPCFATKKGEVLQSINLDLSQYSIVVAKPDVNIPTKNVYSLVTPNNNVQSLEELIKLPIEQWKDTIVNDFEKPIFKQYPKIAALKQKFYDFGAIYSQMTGSGSAIFGIFDKNQKVDFGYLPIVYSEL